jgi:RNA recognition motif-containing protein
MSSDYRPRGTGSSSSSGSSSGGGRRRRGGRNRSGRSGEQRSSGGPGTSHSNGHTTPAKKENPIAKFFGWLSGKKKKPESRPAPARTPRPEQQEREPRAERPRREDRPPRPEPTPQEITTPKLYVGNLSYDAAESDLFDLFSKVGAVKNVEVAIDRHANRSKGFGFVEMETLETAKEAAAKLNRTDFMGRQIVVSGAKVDKRPISREADADSGSSNPDASV